MPKFEYGLWLNTQISVDAPYEFGEAVQDDEFKTGGVELLYNFSQEGLYFTAVALGGKADFPVGDEEDGVDSTLKQILSKTDLPQHPVAASDLNAALTNNAEAEYGERDDMYKFVFGYDRRLNADMVLVLDYVREQEKAKNAEVNLVEAGIRCQLTPLTVIAAGAGAGIGEDSPDFRIAVAFQHSFNAWFFGGR